MARAGWRAQALVLLAPIAAPLASAQLSDLPNLSTATRTSASSTAAPTSSAKSAPSTSPTTDSITSFIATTTSAPTKSPALTTSSASVFHLTGLPTIEGAGIPTIVIPYTAAAPFMQKSGWPEGSVFIIIGAILAFHGACVLLWRGMIAWSINRSVKRAALASIGRGEKSGTNWATGAGYNPVKGAFYNDTARAGSSMSLDALTSTGMKKGHFKDQSTERLTTPPQNLFFSPTAQARESVISMSNPANRNSSSYLPAGHYASPSAHPAGGAGATTLGGASVAPYARDSQVGTSPPTSPNLPPNSRGSASYRGPSRDGALRLSRDGYSARPSRDFPRLPSRDGALSVNRDGYGPSSARNSYIDSGRPPRAHSVLNSAVHSQPSGSSVMAGSGGSGRLSAEGLAGSRAPSAYLEDLFENHGSGPR